MKMKALFCALLAGVAFQAAAAPIPPKPLMPADAMREQEAWEVAQIEAAAQKNLKLFYPSVQSAVSGYFNTHGLKGTAAAAGLVIPWTVMKPVVYVDSDFWGKPKAIVWRDAIDYVHGYAVALGSSQGGCPLFKIKGVNEAHMTYNKGPGAPLDFPPATAICP